MVQTLLADASLETVPNGERANIGLYGSSTQASQSPTNVLDSTITALTSSDGGRQEGIIELIWAVSGPVTGHTVQLDYSFDAGTTWTNIATGVNADDRSYSWVSTNYLSSILGLWRVFSEANTNLYDETDTSFAPPK